MHPRHFISNSICWAAAIIAAAIVGAPSALTTLILPVLAAASLLALGLKPEPPRIARRGMDTLPPKK